MREDLKERVALAVKLTELKNEAFRLRLYETMRKLDTATVTVGWEIAELERKRDGVSDE